MSNPITNNYFLITTLLLLLMLGGCGSTIMNNECYSGVDEFGFNYIGTNQDSSRIVYEITYDQNGNLNSIVTGFFIDSLEYLINEEIVFDGRGNIMTDSSPFISYKESNDTLRLIIKNPKHELSILELNTFELEGSTSKITRSGIFEIPYKSGEYIFGTIIQAEHKYDSIDTSKFYTRMDSEVTVRFEYPMQIDCLPDSLQNILNSVKIQE